MGHRGGGGPRGSAGGSDGAGPARAATSTSLHLGHRARRGMVSVRVRRRRARARGCCGGAGRVAGAWGSCEFEKVRAGWGTRRESPGRGWGPVLRDSLLPHGEFVTTREHPRKEKAARCHCGAAMDGSSAELFTGRRRVFIGELEACSW